MVASVQSAGSAAYVRSSQLSPSSTRPAATEAPDATDLLRESRETERTETLRSTDDRDSLLRQAATTELEDRNDDQTIRTEQARGSLLDLAV